MKKDFDLITFLFWVGIVFYLDPGGFVSSSNEGNIDQTNSSVFDLGIIAFSIGCLILKYNSKENALIKEKFIQWYSIIIIIWAVYYFLWYYGLNSSVIVSPVKMIMRNKRMIGQILLVFPIAYFASINLVQFIKILIWTTIVIMIMYLLTVFFNIPLVDLVLYQRGFQFDLTRYYMKGFGLMFLSLPIAISMLTFGFKRDNLILIAGILIIVLIIIMISRRDMVGIIEYILIIAFFVNYIRRKKPFQFILQFINIKSLAYLTLVVLLGFLYPNFYLVAKDIAENTFRTAILGETTKDRGEDVRMSLTAQYGIVNAIKENFFLGTGYDPSWSTGDGGVKGFEGSDYIFLAAFGMYGLVGLLIFLPFYLITAKLIFRFLKLLRSNLNLININKEIFMYPVIIGLATSAEFVKNIIEYPNWFYPIGAISSSPKYFIYFGLLVGSYRLIQKHILSYKLNT